MLVSLLYQLVSFLLAMQKQVLGKKTQKTMLAPGLEKLVFLHKLVQAYDEDVSQQYDDGPNSNIATELRCIQQEVLDLDDPQDYDQVVKYLQQKRDLLLLTFELIVQHNLPESFLLASKQEAFDNLKFHGHDLSRRCFQAEGFSRLAFANEFFLPEPLLSTDEITKKLFPVQTYLLNDGDSLWACTARIHNAVNACLCPLDAVSKEAVHSEFSAMDLRLHDVAKQGWSSNYFAASKNFGPEDAADLVGLLTIPYHKNFVSPVNPEWDRSAVGAGEVNNTALLLKCLDEQQRNDLVEGSVKNPIQIYTIKKLFVILMIRMKTLRQSWLQMALDYRDLDTVQRYKHGV
ncbi:hypothetical protein Ciccas_010808 [Cichlidogyrus casuarinus]|uniref:Uncharacterized protein n=1 Tax=Cichlidogyrus casuarinus TaxID=1844966 RepID=A0ABD2PT28_9PLAT